MRRAARRRPRITSVTIASTSAAPRPIGAAPATLQHPPELSGGAEPPASCPALASACEPSTAPPSLPAFGTQTPPTQWAVVGHEVLAHGSFTHIPFMQTCPPMHVTPMHASTQLPMRHTKPGMHVTDAQGSGTHAPALHSWPGGHATPVHPSMQVPPMQN